MFLQRLRKRWYLPRNTSPDYWAGVLPPVEELSQQTKLARESIIAPQILSRTAKSQKVLDAGCGPMIWAPLFLEKGVEYFGLDYSEELLRRGNEVQAKEALSRSIRGDVTSLPISTNSFDMYLSLGILEHFESGMLAPLKEGARIVAPGGYLCISVPYLNWLRATMLPFELTLKTLRNNRLLRRLMKRGDVPQEIFYQFAYSLKELKALFRNADLQVVSSHPFEWEYGLTRDYRIFRQIRRQFPFVFDLIQKLFKFVNKHSCAHMILIVAKKHSLN